MALKNKHIICTDQDCNSPLLRNNGRVRIFNTLNQAEKELERTEEIDCHYIKRIIKGHPLTKKHKLESDEDDLLEIWQVLGVEHDENDPRLQGVW